LFLVLLMFIFEHSFWHVIHLFPIAKQIERSNRETQMGGKKEKNANYFTEKMSFQEREQSYVQKSMKDKRGGEL